MRKNHPPLHLYRQSVATLPRNRRISSAKTLHLSQEMPFPLYLSITSPCPLYSPVVTCKSFFVRSGRKPRRAQGPYASTDRQREGTARATDQIAGSRHGRYALDADGERRRHAQLVALPHRRRTDGRKLRLPGTQKGRREAEHAKHSRPWTEDTLTARAVAPTRG